MNKNIALVLSGGGARGIAHIGVIEELEKRGYTITSIAGTSMGSIIGAYYAMGKLDVFKEFLLHVDKRKTFQLLDFSLGSLGLVKGDKIIKQLKELVPDEQIENLKIPYVAVATNLRTKKEVIFNKGSIYEAIRASISIPSFFTPVEVDDGLLIDGGVLNNLPLRYIKRFEGDSIFAVDVNADTPLIHLPDTKKDKEEKLSLYRQKLNEFNEQIEKLKPKGFSDAMKYFQLIEDTISLMMEQITKVHLANNPPGLLINISRNTCTTFDFFKSKELIEIGRLAAIKSLDEFELG